MRASYVLTVLPCFGSAFYSPLLRSTAREQNAVSPTLLHNPAARAPINIVIMQRAAAATASLELDDDAQQSSSGALSFLPEAWQPPATKFLWLCFSYLLLKLLRPFASVLLSTFVMCFIAQSFVTNGLKLLKRVSEPFGFSAERTQLLYPIARRYLVITFFVSIVAIISTLVVSSVPRIVADSQYLLAVSASDDPYIFAANTIRNLLGDVTATRVENFLSWRETGVAITGKVTSGSWSGERSSRFVALVASQIKGPVQTYLSNVVAITRAAAGALLGGLVQGVVSLLFSLIIMWDLPAIAKGVRSIGAGSRRQWVRSLYGEVAPKVSSLALIMGRSFEAQALIAVVNTILTTLGMIALGLPGVVFLALFVLLCSFVPVAGFFLSTIPMMLVALTEYGINKMLLVRNRWCIIARESLHLRIRQRPPSCAALSLSHTCTHTYTRTTRTHAHTYTHGARRWC